MTYIYISHNVCNAFDLIDRILILMKPKITFTTLPAFPEHVRGYRRYAAIPSFNTKKLVFPVVLQHAACALNYV